MNYKRKKTSELQTEKRAYRKRDQCGWTGGLNTPKRQDTNTCMVQHVKYSQF